MAAGIHIVSKRLASGVKTHYVYAWRGGPPIHRTQGERKPSLTLSLHDAAADARRARPEQDASLLRHLADSWQSSGEYARLSKGSQRTFQTWIPRINEKFGDVPLSVFDDHKMKLDIVEWRDGWSDQPRSADHAVQSIRRILSFGQSTFKLNINCAFKIPPLYEADRSYIVWTKDDIEAFMSTSRTPLVEALKLEGGTGLRRTDLVAVTWDAVDDATITWKTSKSKRKKTVIIPLLPETRDLLATIKKRHADDMASRVPGKRVPLPSTILSMVDWKPWSPDGLGKAFSRAMMAADVDKHLHDMRGNFVTRLAIAGLPADQIADIVGWSLAGVQEMLKRYVNKGKLAQSQAHLIAKVGVA
jgi:integrase